MNKTSIAVASVCIVIAVLSPIASYLYFSDRFNAASESYNVQISDLLDENEQLKEENEKLRQKAPFLTEPYLVTTLGWYLHGSTDIFPDSRNKLTIYGNILNVGATNATNCKLMVKFYDNITLLQSSEVHIGTIRYWSYSHVYDYIDCKFADNVTRIEVERTWTNMP